MKTALKVALLSTVFALSLALPVRAERLKDVTNVLGARSNQLVGYGLVVGLDSTGDGRKAEFTLQSVAAMLRRMGVRIDPANVKIKNAAAVMVTAEIPAFARTGQRIDVTVSSLGDAKSLRGGTLIQTPLLGADRKVYAVAQGPVSVGGFTAGGKGGSTTTNHPTVGRIPSGAMIESEIVTSIQQKNIVRLALNRPDPMTASRIASAINTKLGGAFATADDPGMISVRIPDGVGSAVALLSVVGEVDVTEDARAKIVINERTGTIVIGANVQLKPAAVAHGGLTVEIQERKVISQPNTPFGGGQTVTSDETTINAQTAPGEMHLLPAAATVGDLVNALNALGVKPSDLIIIFQTLASAGAVTADIEVQ